MKLIEPSCRLERRKYFLNYYSMTKYSKTIYIINTFGNDWEDDVALMIWVMPNGMKRELTIGPNGMTLENSVMDDSSFQIDLFFELDEHEYNMAILGESI